MMAYQAKEYWERRFGARFSLSAAGHQGFSEHYGINAEGRSVLDVGCGTGFFVDYYTQRSAIVTGIDITDISVMTLSAKFPSCAFVRAYISSPDIGLKEAFDIVNAFDVLYHIVDDNAFERAIGNIGERCKQGGWILLTDALDPRKSISEHVRYRDLETYTAALGRAGIDIVGLIPAFRSMGRRVSPAVKNELVRKALGRVIESLAWFSYILDAAYCPIGSFLIRLLVCRKR